MNMKQTTLASAMALAMGMSSSASALKISVSNMNFGKIYGAAGFLYDTGTGHTYGGSGGYGLMASTEPFNGNSWVANAVKFWNTHSTPLTWTGTFGGKTWEQGTITGTKTTQVHSPLSVNSTKTINTTSPGFHLSGNQVAWGTLFNWSTSTDIPVLVIMDCAPGTTGSTCRGVPGTPMAAGPFVGSDPVFNGAIATGSTPFSGAVPIPAAAWLFGSGLVGLAGIGRRRKKKD